jgi:excisionase family DNA binding protein
MMSAVSELPPARVAYSMSEAAASLGVSLSTVKNLIAQGRLKTARIGRRVLIPASSLESLLSA